MIHSSSCARRAGFTLIELLVVLVILIIVIGVSVTTIPSFASPRQRLRTDARDLLGLLRDARQTAMLRKMKIDVCVDSQRRIICVIDSVRARQLALSGDSVFDEMSEEEDSVGYFRAVSFGEDIQLMSFPPEAVLRVLPGDEDPFAKIPEDWEDAEEGAVALTFTTFGGSSGGGVSLLRGKAQLHIACDILTGEPEVVDLY